MEQFVNGNTSLVEHKLWLPADFGQIGHLLTGTIGLPAYKEH